MPCTFREIAGTQDYRLISNLIAAQGTPTAGASYTFTDHNVEAGITYDYWLVDLTHEGNLSKSGKTTTVASTNGSLIDDLKPSIRNCLIYGNTLKCSGYRDCRRRGGGISFNAGHSCEGSEPVVANTTIADNDRHGVYAAGYSKPTLTDCIIWGNSEASSDDIQGFTITGGGAQGYEENGSGAGFGGSNTVRERHSRWFVCYTRDESVEGVFRSS